jgi:hypothetical protein
MIFLLSTETTLLCKFVGLLNLVLVKVDGNETLLNSNTDCCNIIFAVSRGSSVSIVSRYLLETCAVELRSPAEAKDFSSNLCVQTGSGAHPASCTMGTGGPLPGS